MVNEADLLTGIKQSLGRLEVLQLLDSRIASVGRVAATRHLENL